MYKRGQGVQTHSILRALSYLFYMCIVPFISSMDIDYHARYSTLMSSVLLGSWRFSWGSSHDGWMLSDHSSEDNVRWGTLYVACLVWSSKLRFDGGKVTISNIVSGGFMDHVTKGGSLYNTLWAPCRQDLWLSILYFDHSLITQGS